MNYAQKTCLGIVIIKASIGIQFVVSFQKTSFVWINFYIILGKPHKDFSLFASVIAALGALGSFTYAYALKDREKRKIS